MNKKPKKIVPPFKKQLMDLIKSRNITLVELAQKVNVQPALLSASGYKKPMPYGLLRKIFEALDVEMKEELQILLHANFSHSREPLIIDDRFIYNVNFILRNKYNTWENDRKQACSVILRLAGVKSKVVKG